MDLETGKVLSVVAVMEENGVMALYVDGVRVARSNGLADVEGFKITQRQEAWVGRWMRPDQSLPTNAHFFSLDVFDGAMDEDGVRTRHAHAVHVQRHHAVLLHHRDDAEVRYKYVCVGNGVSRGGGHEDTYVRV